MYDCSQDFVNLGAILCINYFVVAVLADGFVMCVDAVVFVVIIGWVAAGLVGVLITCGASLFDGFNSCLIVAYVSYTYIV